jgi:hypothetical protein
MARRRTGTRAVLPGCCADLRGRGMDSGGGCHCSAVVCAHGAATDRRSHRLVQPASRHLVSISPRRRQLLSGAHNRRGDRGAGSGLGFGDRAESADPRGRSDRGGVAPLGAAGGAGCPSDPRGSRACASNDGADGADLADARRHGGDPRPACRCRCGDGHVFAQRTRRPPTGRRSQRHRRGAPTHSSPCSRARSPTPSCPGRTGPAHMSR